MNQLIEIGWPQQIERRREPGGKKWKWKGGKNSHDFPPEFPPPINTPLNWFDFITDRIWNYKNSSSLLPPPSPFPPIWLGSIRIVQDRSTRAQFTGLSVDSNGIRHASRISVCGFYGVDWILKDLLGLVRIDWDFLIGGDLPGFVSNGSGFCISVAFFTHDSQILWGRSWRSWTYPLPPAGLPIIFSLPCKWVANASPGSTPGNSYPPLLLATRIFRISRIAGRIPPFNFFKVQTRLSRLQSGSKKK